MTYMIQKQSNCGGGSAIVKTHIATEEEAIELARQFAGGGRVVPPSPVLHKYHYTVETGGQFYYIISREY